MLEGRGVFWALVPPRHKNARLLCRVFTSFPGPLQLAFYSFSTTGHRTHSQNMPTSSALPGFSGSGASASLSLLLSLLLHSLEHTSSPHETLKGQRRESIKSNRQQKLTARCLAGPVQNHLMFTNVIR